jgi:SAM-dependent methyltransferase
METLRSPEQLREHYEIEKTLAARLRNSTKQERREQQLYLQVYDELFKRVPHHPQLSDNLDPIVRKQQILRQLILLSPYIVMNGSFLELGAGDCQLSFEMCRHMTKVYAVDVSQEITKNLTPPANFELRFSDGASIPLPPESIHLAFSNNLMEHCHPDDVVDQLNNLFQCLVPGGHYLCITPHRFSGPHDISKYFTSVATGFHLQEFTHLELYRLFKTSGFKRVEAILSARGIFWRVPIQPLLWLERLLALLPETWRRTFCRRPRLDQILQIRLLATKP